MSIFIKNFPQQVCVLPEPAGPVTGDRRLLRQGRIRVAVGVRSAVFAPVEQLGLVVVDEERPQTLDLLAEDGDDAGAADSGTAEDAAEPSPGSST